MTPLSEAKAAAIAKACEVEPWNLPAVLAMLTSPSKEEREHAKAVVRAMVATGRTAIEREQGAAEAANRFEP